MKQSIWQKRQTKNKDCAELVNGAQHKKERQKTDTETVLLWMEHTTEKERPTENKERLCPTCKWSTTHGQERQTDRKQRERERERDCALFVNGAKHKTREKTDAERDCALSIKHNTGCERLTENRETVPNLWMEHNTEQEWQTENSHRMCPIWE